MQEPREFQISYTMEKSYTDELFGGFWQFLIVPEDNLDQELLLWDYESTVPGNITQTTSGLGFTALQFRTREKLDHIRFQARFKVEKTCMELSEQKRFLGIDASYAMLDGLVFKIDHEPYLRITPATCLPNTGVPQFILDRKKPILENLISLNQLLHGAIAVREDVGTPHSLKQTLQAGYGTPGDLAQLFCAMGRKNGIPARYVSGYYFGEGNIQVSNGIHNWVEAFVPEMGKWIGFDPSIGQLAGQGHLKICHGKDYLDCLPYKEMVFAMGNAEADQRVAIEASSQ